MGEDDGEEGRQEEDVDGGYDEEGYPVQGGECIHYCRLRVMGC